MTDQLRISNQDFSLKLIRIENESSFKELPTTQTSINLVPERFQLQQSVPILDNYLSPDFTQNENEQIRLFQNTDTIAESEDSLLLQDLEPDWLPYVQSKNTIETKKSQKEQKIILDSSKKSKDFHLDDIEEKKIVQLRQRCHSFDMKSSQLHEYTQNEFKSLKSYREPEFITIKIKENKKQEQKNLCKNKIRQRKFTIDTQITENLQVPEEKSLIRQTNSLVSLNLDSQKLDQSLLLSRESDLDGYLTEQKISLKDHKKCNKSQNIPHTFNQIKIFSIGQKIVEKKTQQSQQKQFLDPQFFQICKEKLLSSEQYFDAKENTNQSQLKIGQAINKRQNVSNQNGKSKVQTMPKIEEGKQKISKMKTSLKNLNETVSYQRTLQKFNSIKQSHNFKQGGKQMNRVAKTTKTQENKSVEKEKKSFKAKNLKVQSQTVIDFSQTNQMNHQIDLIQKKHENQKKCEKNIKQIDVQTELFVSHQSIELEKALEQNRQLKLKVKSQEILRQGLELKFCRLQVEIQRINVQIARQQLQNENMRLKIEMKENQNIKLLIKDKKLTLDLETMSAKISTLLSQKMSFVRQAEETNKKYTNCLKNNSAYIEQIEGLKKKFLLQQRSIKNLQTQFKSQKLKIDQQSQQLDKLHEQLKKLNHKSDKLQYSNQILNKKILSLTQQKQNLKQGLVLRHQESLLFVKYLRSPRFKMNKAHRYVENHFDAEKNSTIIFKDNKNLSDILNKMRQIQYQHNLLKQSIFLKNIQQTYAIDLIQSKINYVDQINQPILKIKIFLNQNYCQQQILKSQKNQNLLQLCDEKNIQPLPIKLQQLGISELYVKPLWNQVLLYDYDCTQQQDKLYQSNLQVQSQIGSVHQKFQQQSNAQHLPKQFRSQFRISDENQNALYQLGPSFSQIYAFLDRFLILLKNKIRFNFYN